MNFDYRLILLFIIAVAIDLYAFQAVRVIAMNHATSVKNIIYASFWFSTFLVILAIIFNDRAPQMFLIYLRAIVFIIYIAKIFMIAPLLIEDIVRLFRYVYGQLILDGNIDVSRRKFVSKISVGLGMIPLATLFYGMLGNQYRFRTLNREIKFKNLSDSFDGLKIVQLSDIHSGTFAFVEPLKGVVETINKLNPDIVVFTGDLVNSKAEEALPFVDIFKEISAKYGVFSIMGNHDYSDYYDWESEEEKLKNNRLFTEIHKSMGWDLIKNDHRVLDINGSKFGLIGVENYSELPQFPKYGDLSKSVEGMGNVAFKLLLSHDPTHWKGQVTRSFKDINLTLSGHTHGFQFGIEVPGYIKWSPSQYVYDEWADLYTDGEQKLYVNRGLGSLAYPGRVGILPEITLITLKKA